MSTTQFEHSPQIATCKWMGHLTIDLRVVFPSLFLPLSYNFKNGIVLHNIFYMTQGINTLSKLIEFRLENQGHPEQDKMEELIVETRINVKSLKKKRQVSPDRVE